MPGAHGLSRASFGENQAGLEEKVQGVGMGVGGSVIVPQASEPKGISAWNLQLGRMPLSSCAPRGPVLGRWGAGRHWMLPGQEELVALC